MFSIDFHIQIRADQKMDFHPTFAIFIDFMDKPAILGTSQLKSLLSWTLVIKNIHFATLVVKNMDFTDFPAILMTKNKNFKH